MTFKKGQSGNPGGRWKPGQSGNPGGRPKSKLFREALMRQLALRSKPGEPDKGYDDMAAAIVAKVEAGDISAFKEMADRIDGKVPTPIGGTDELPSIKGFAWIDPTQEDNPVTESNKTESDGEESVH